MAAQQQAQTILVADDEPEVVKLMRMVLEWESYTVVEASDGEQALDQARAAMPDLILLDVRMPKMNGLDVLEQLQADPVLAPIPVVMLSVITTFPQVETALRKGAIAYLPKPFELSEMTRFVRRILSSDVASRQLMRQRALQELSGLP